jgi:F0F1-type ATP synthase epsilon subunit
MSIALTIVLPQATCPTVEADKVVLPIAEGTLTVIKDRAPEVRLLTPGYLRLLDADNQTFRQWKISDGLVDIAQDTCRVLVKEANEEPL